MILFGIVQRLLALLSVVALGVGAWLIWAWYDLERTARAVDPALNPDETPLYWGTALISWAFLGRLPVLLALGRGGGVKHRLARAPARMVQGADGSSLRVEEYGPVEAPCIVLTHGWGLDSTLWIEAKRQLADRFRLVVWDLPGLGKSSPPADGKYSIERMAADLKAVIQAASPRGKVVLVGHSIGGMIVQTLFRDHPEFAHERVGGVVLENTTHTNPLATMVMAKMWLALQKPVLEPLQKLDIPLSPLLRLINWQSYLSGSTHIAFRLVGFGTQPTRGQLDQSALVATRNSPAVQAKGNLAMMNWSVTEALGAVGVPVLVFCGGRDIVTLPGAGETIAGSVKRGESIFQERAGHMGPVEQAAEYNRRIAPFADEVLIRAMPQAAPENAIAAPRPASDGMGRGDQASGARDSLI